MKTEQDRTLKRSLMLMGTFVAWVVFWVVLAFVITFGVQTPSHTTSARSGSVRLPQRGDQVRVAGSDGRMHSGTLISVGTRLERIDPALLRSWEHLSSQLGPAAMRFKGIDDVEAMRRYQEQWDSYKAGGRRVSPPLLYPSPLQRMLESTR